VSRGRRDGRGQPERETLGSVAGDVGVLTPPEPGWHRACTFADGDVMEHVGQRKERRDVRGCGMTLFEGPGGETSGPSPATDIEVLVVGSDELARSRLTALVATFGVSVRGAADADQARHLVRERRSDLILCAIPMRGFDGVGFIRRLRRDRPLLVVAVTGPGPSPDVARARDAGFDGHVAEPITAAAVARLLDRVLDLRNAEDR
jgi:CheY-like chemotaxis protein